MITIALRKRTLSPVSLVLEVTFSVVICHSGVSLYFWGVLTRLDKTRLSTVWRSSSTHSGERAGKIQRHLKVFIVLLVNLIAQSRLATRPQRKKNSTSTDNSACSALRGLLICFGLIFELIQ